MNYNRHPTYFQPRNGGIRNPTAGAVIRSRTGRKLIAYFAALTIIGILIMVSFRDMRESAEAERELTQRFMQSRIYQGEKGAPVANPNAPIANGVVSELGLEDSTENENHDLESVKAIDDLTEDST
ncbi:uncharacterized protein V2V93DRAFT_357429 [Kockiozyma suomiensis]|uniref:uncharacterized protein n=1 Tax=Kockiozyma suomiensis TaxID=1337062 RepID=UPI003343F203